MESYVKSHENHVNRNDSNIFKEVNHVYSDVKINESC